MAFVWPTAMYVWKSHQSQVIQGLLVSHLRKPWGVHGCQHIEAHGEGRSWAVELILTKYVEELTMNEICTKMLHGSKAVFALQEFAFHLFKFPKRSGCYALITKPTTVTSTRPWRCGRKGIAASMKGASRRRGSEWMAWLVVRFNGTKVDKRRKQVGERSLISLSQYWASCGCFKSVGWLQVLNQSLEVLHPFIHPKYLHQKGLEFGQVNLPDGVQKSSCFSRLCATTNGRAGLSWCCRPNLLSTSAIPNSMAVELGLSYMKCWAILEISWVVSKTLAQILLAFIPTMAQTVVAAMLGAAGTAFIAPGSSPSAPAPALRGAVASEPQGSSAGVAGTAALASLAGVALAAAAGRKASATTCRAAAVKKKGVKVVHGKERNPLKSFGKLVWSRFLRF